MTKVLHVKLPVTDLQRSVTWYGRLMDLALAHEFVEEDELRGAALRSAEGGFSIALRLREHCAGKPDLTGHDVAAFHVESREVLLDVQRRAADLGASYTDVQERGPGQAVVDVVDPDGTGAALLLGRPGRRAGDVHRLRLRRRRATGARRRAPAGRPGGAQPVSVADRGIWTAPGGARIAWFLDPDRDDLSLHESTPEHR